MKQTFSISEVFHTSWKYTKSQLAILCGLLIGYMIIAFTFSILILPAQTSIPGIIISNLIAAIIGALFSMGYLKNLFQTLDDIEPQFSAYGQQAPKILTYLIVNVIISVIICIGFALLIIPGIYLTCRLQFAPAFIIEENAGIVDSIKRSWDITEGKVMKLFCLFLVMLLITLLGTLLLGIGLFIAIPLIYMMYCYCFRLLNSPLQVFEEA